MEELKKIFLDIFTEKNCDEVLTIFLKKTAKEFLENSRETIQRNAYRNIQRKKNYETFLKKKSRQIPKKKIRKNNFKTEEVLEGFKVKSREYPRILRKNFSTNSLWNFRKIKSQ